MVGGACGCCCFESCEKRLQCDQDSRSNQIANSIAKEPQFGSLILNREAGCPIYFSCLDPIDVLDLADLVAMLPKGSMLPNLVGPKQADRMVKSQIERIAHMFSRSDPAPSGLHVSATLFDVVSIHASDK